MASNDVVKISFATLPYDVMTRIALTSILFSKEVPIPGDLATLLALVITCRAIHNVLSLDANPDLYATVFRLMFDIPAIKRRLGTGAVASSSLAREFPARIKTLTRIKAASEEGFWHIAEHRDNWNLHGNSYVRQMLLMMAENEEKNSYQLTCSGVLELSNILVSQLLRFGLDSTPPSHQPCMTLTFALMWMLSSQDSLAHEDPILRAAILDYLEPLMVRANEPSNDFNDLVDKTQTPHLYTPSRYFGFNLHVKMPTITQLARLCSVDRYNAAKNMYVLDRRLPRNRVFLTAPILSPWTGIGGFKTRYSSPSTRFDVDWLRMLSILDFPPSEKALTGNAYLVGNFEGMFEGDFFITHPIDNSLKFFTSSKPMQCTLREYHSGSPHESLRFDEGGDRREGEALARGWFPEGIDLEEGATSLVVRDRSQGRLFHYRPYPEYSEFTDQGLPPVYDTILIGETHPSYASYGQYKFRGRVRARDGTVALIRMPVEPNIEDEGTWVFVGHLQAETDFVGDWRVASIGEDIPGGHGWFHISKTQVFGPLGI